MLCRSRRDAAPADSHHQDTVKQDIVTVTIETNLRQGNLETEVDGTKGDLTETEPESTRRCLCGRRVELYIFDQNRAVVCLRKRKPDDFSTSVLSVKVNGIQTGVGESSLWLGARLF